MPRRKGEEEPKLVVVTPGAMYPSGLFFEQVADANFVEWDDEGKTLVKQPQITYNEIYVPLRRVPWMLCQEPQEPEGADVLWQQIRDFIFEHLFLPDPALYDVLTAWVIATWTSELWSVVPYIFFMGPVSSGKTRGLEVLHRLSYRAIISANISTAALFRACEQWHPTLVLDETEIYSRNERGEIIGLLNSGYRRGQYAVRAKNTEQGTELEVFDVFGFKALAGTQTLRATLESRSIIVPMIKNRRKVRLFIDEKRAHELRCRLLMYRMRTLRFEATKETLCTPTETRLAALSEQFLARVPPLDFADGRLQELFQCLLACANHGQKNIIAYAQKMEKTRLCEEMASEEAELVDILLDSNLVMEEGVALTREVADKFNESRAEREKWKASSVGRLMRRLGFEKRHTMHGNGWLVDKERLSYLAQIYRGEAGTPGKGSEGSDGSSAHPSSIHQNEPYERCEPFPEVPTTQDIIEKVRSGLTACFEQSKLVERIAGLGFPREEAEKRVQWLIDKGLIARDDVGLWHWIPGG